MADAKIIKALELCVNNGYPYGCIDCPYHNRDCNDGLDADALDLIKRQKAEIERFTVNMNAFGLGMKRERERADSAIKAIKNFARKFKAKSVVGRIDNFDMGYQITDDEFDNLVKEMVGDAY